MKNPGARPAKVSLWHDRPTGGTTDIDTIIAAYARSTIPMTDADRAACSSGVGDTCDGTPCATDTDWAALNGTDQVTIPAGGSVIVYSAPFSGSITGTYKLNATTESLL
ncbi:MAG: hypothetical protein HOO96_24720 [Polyangiaceae bacterium]|nr:hypothetical protein [Polyangiaceae bacterium]